MSGNATRHVLSLCATVFCACLSMSADVEPDSVTSLSEIVVKGHGRRMPRMALDGSLHISSHDIESSPRFFGEADVMRAVRTQAGITAISDYASGLAVDGMDNANTGYDIEGVPVHFPYHFGGIYSVFSPWQYPDMTLSKSIRDAGKLPVTGGLAELSGRKSAPGRLYGTANIGMTASSAGVRAPLSRRLWLSVSARASYIDALYSRLLSSSTYDMRYNFHDADLSASYLFPDSSEVRLFGHYNADRLRCGDMNYGFDCHLHWHNALTGLLWAGKDAEVRIYYTEMANRLSFDMGDVGLVLPSYIRQTGAYGCRSMSVGSMVATAGLRADFYRIRPQTVLMEGLGAPIYQDMSATSSLQTAMWANFTIPFGTDVRIEAGAEANGYYSNGFHATDIDPRLSFFLGVGGGTLCLHAGRYHQYIHQTGLSEIGMPSNFKLAASRQCLPQQNINLAAAYSAPLCVLDMRLRIEAYYKRVLSQPEYFGGVLDLLSANGSAESFVRMCNGYNYGGSVSLSRDFCALTANINYSYGAARRRLPGSAYFTASSQIRHAVSATVSYMFPGDKWQAGAFFTYMSGRPVTPVRAVYIIGQQPIVEYGKRNSSALPAYHRLDLSASYVFRCRATHNTISFSLINAYGHANAEMVRYRYDDETGSIRKSYSSSLYRFMPSLSYTVDL